MRNGSTTRIPRATSPAALTALLVATLLAGAAPAVRAADRPAIEAVAVYARAGAVCGDVRSAGLFSERVAGTVQSGLPAVVELDWRLVTGDGKARQRGLIRYEIICDVWDDVYTIGNGDTALAFDSFEEMAARLERLTAVALVPLDGLEGETSYALEFAISVHPLQGSEREQIVGWVDEQVGGPSSRGWRERLLNVGDLIGDLFSREDEETFRSEWMRSTSFTRSTLRRESSRYDTDPVPVALALRVRVAPALSGGGGR